MNFTWVLVVSHIQDFLFFFANSLLFLSFLTVVDDSLDPQPALSKGNFISMLQDLEQGPPVSVVEFLWKSGVVLWTEGSREELVRAHCATVLLVISPTGCLVISESVAYTDWLTVIAWTLQPASWCLRARTSSFARMNPHTQVQEPTAGHILARKTLKMAPPSEFVFFHFYF